MTLLSLPSSHCSDSPAPKGEDHLRSVFALPSRRQSSPLRSTSGRLALYFSRAARAAGDGRRVAGRGLWEKIEGRPTGAKVSMPVRIDPSLAHIPFCDTRISYNALTYAQYFWYFYFIINIFIYVDTCFFLFHTCLLNVCMYE